MRDHISLYINGQAIDLRGEEVFLSLSDFLRRRMAMPGTKVVCAEGDCGSCAVILGRPIDGRMEYGAVTSCIQMMFQLDGMHVVTIEGLRDGEELNPIQKAMVDCHGAQCGFCTPGFVVSMYDAMEKGGVDDSASLKRALVGNLCRCTGYESIIRAGMQTDRARLRKLDILFPPEPIAAALADAARCATRINAGGRTFFKPTTIEEAVAFLAEHPAAVIVAGATDIGVQVNKHIRALGEVLGVSCIEELKKVQVDDAVIWTGAGVSLSLIESLCMKHLPELGRFLAWFGSPLIKNAGTIGGNLVNASPIGDMLPAMFALGAKVEIAGPAGRRSAPIEQFYIGYRKTTLRPDELLAGVAIPLPQTNDRFRLYKMSRRKDLDISTVSSAIRVRVENNVIVNACIAVGGVAATVVRLREAEGALIGRIPDAQLFDAAGLIAAAAIKPLTDVRGSAAYRTALVRRTLTRFWMDEFADSHSNTGVG